jgi:hypothetical protein
MMPNSKPRLVTVPEVVTGTLVVVWTSLGPLLWWVPGPTTQWALGLLDFCYTVPAGVEHKDCEGIVLG